MTDLLAEDTAADPAPPAVPVAPAASSAVPFDAPDPGTGLRSALYEGTLGHARLDATRHGFTYDVTMAYLALEELPEALDAHPLWSARHLAPVRFRRRDFHGPPGVPLDDAVRATVAEATGAWPTGPIRLLATLRTWAWSFNPIVLYYVLTADGLGLEAVVAEVTNTPWHERHAYVLPVTGAAATELPATRFPKALHVSPFLDMDLDHSLASTAPGAPHLTVRMDDWRGGDRIFAATLRLHRLPLDRSTMGAVLRRQPFPAQRVSAGIYRQALALRRKGAPFRRHPKHTSSPSPSSCPARSHP